MTVDIKNFSDLSTIELYEILRLRSEVFVVEQDCVYQDIDNKDQKALHVLGYDQNKLVAYTRLFGPGEYFVQSSIGRVVVNTTYRNKKYGYNIMNSSIEAIKDFYKTTEVKISAQKHLEKFYNNLGFKTIGEPYLEDGIPHIGMMRN